MAIGTAQKLIVHESVEHKVDDESRFDDLVNALKEALGPSSGLACEDVDVAYLQQLMERYDSREKEWSRYAFRDRSRGYTRNLVDEGNGKSNLVRWPFSEKSE
jgi:cysteine dioxygenase